MDWPGLNNLTKATPNLTTFSGGVQDYTAAIQTATATATWPGANRAYYIAVHLTDPTTITQIGLIVGVQSGNLDVGVYNWAGARLVSSGSTAVAAAGSQLVDIADTVLPGGIYHLGMACDNATATFQRSSSINLQDCRFVGVQQQAAAFPLPATAVFATTTSGYIPWLVGLTSGVTVF